jgi:branched-chain amino acid transport system ATP-binding protein
MSATIIEVADLDVYYGTSQILFGVGLSVRQGETMALLGPQRRGQIDDHEGDHGAGAAAAGQDQPARRGDLGPEAAPYRARRSRLRAGGSPDLSGAHGRGQSRHRSQEGAGGQDEWPIKRIYDVFPLLEPLRHRIAGRLSGGEQQMLAIARTLMGNPALLLLDEPSEGLAPIIVQRIGELLRQLRQLGSTVLIAEQNMHFCLGLASHATVIDKGQIVYAAGIDELKANDAIRRRYLAL